MVRPATIAAGAISALLGLASFGLAGRPEDEAAALRARLGALGPTPDERLAVLELTAAEKDAIREQIAGFAYRQRPGSAALVRRNRRDLLLDTHGVKATRELTHAVSRGAEAYWPARISAQALGLLAADSDDARWLMYYLDAPRALIDLYGRGPWAERPGLAGDLDAALGAISDGVARSGADAWAEWWADERPRWEAAQARKAALRADLLRRLEELGAPGR